MKTIADMKRALTEGTMLEVTNYKYPELSGLRTVVKAQSQRFKMTLPADHPRATDVEGSWLDFPKSKDASFVWDGVLITSNGEAFCHIKVAS